MRVEEQDAEEDEDAQEGEKGVVRTASGGLPSLLIHIMPRSITTLCMIRFVAILMAGM